MKKQSDATRRTSRKEIEEWRQFAWEHRDEMESARIVALADEITTLRWTLEQIVKTPSEKTLLLNAEARAMYELAKRTLEANP